MEPMKGIEPLTCGLRNRCSTAELHRQPFGVYPVGFYIVTPYLLISKIAASPGASIYAKIPATAAVATAVGPVAMYAKSNYDNLEVQHDVHANLYWRRRPDPL
jgi:hypothetical protein